MTSTQTSTSTSVAIRAAEVRNYWAQVPARINQASVQAVEKANNAAGWFSVAAGGAALAAVTGSVMASSAGKLTVTLLKGSVDAKTLGVAAAIGMAAGAAPAVTGWLSTFIGKDGPARGLLEGTGVAAMYFVGLLGGVASGWGEGAVWLGAISGSLATLAYAGGVVKRW